MSGGFAGKALAPGMSRCFFAPLGQLPTKAGAALDSIRLEDPADKGTVGRSAPEGNQKGAPATDPLPNASVNMFDNLWLLPDEEDLGEAEEDEPPRNMAEEVRGMPYGG